MSVHVELPSGKFRMSEFLQFYDRVHEHRSARWPAFVQFELSVLDPRSPYLAGRIIQPLVARDGDRIAARALAVFVRGTAAGADQRCEQQGAPDPSHAGAVEQLLFHVKSARITRKCAGVCVTAATRVSRSRSPSRSTWKWCHMVLCSAGA